MHFGGLFQRHWFLVPQAESAKSSLNQPALGTLAPCCCHLKFCFLFLFFFFRFYFERILRVNKKVSKVCFSPYLFFPRVIQLRNISREGLILSTYLCFPEASQELS